MAHRATLQTVVAAVRRGQVTTQAAGIAYFGLSSLLPFVFLAVVGLTTVGGEAWIERITTASTAVLGDEFGRPLADAATSSRARAPSTAVGLAVLLWGTLRLYRSSDRAFAAVYDDRKSTSVTTRFRNAVVVFATNAGALALLCAVGLWFATTGTVARVLAPVVLFGTLIAVFLPMFYWFSPASATLVEILPGAVVAAGAWSVASVGLRLYIEFAHASTYGLLGALLLASTWLYVGALAMLFGAALNAVRAGRVDPDDEWVPTDYM